MKDFLDRFQHLTREMGVEIGRSLAERVIAQRLAAGASVRVAPVAEPGAAPPVKAPKAPKARTPKAHGNTAEAAPKILPGLSGRRRKPGEPPPPCGRTGCEKPSRTRGYCQTHYVQWLKSGR